MAATHVNAVHDTELLADIRAIQAAIAAHPTLAGLHASGDWPAVRTRLDRVLSSVRRHEPPLPPPAAASPDTLHVIQWNIEHGNRYAQVEQALIAHPSLAGADLVLLNEADVGMARGGNRDVAADLAAALGLHVAWAPLFVESTVGRDDDAQTAKGLANRESLFGLAILSRWPIGATRLVPMSGPEQIQYDVERMLGRFVALVAEIRHPVTPFVAVSAHLEVHRTREHRAAQVREVVRSLADEGRPIVIAGDWNTHTFDRGLWHSPLSGALPLLTWTPGALSRRLQHPDRGAHREPLFEVLRAARFAWETGADYAPTLQLRFDRLDELNAWPLPLRLATRRVLAWAEQRGRLRLDWIAARGLACVDGHTVHGLDGPGRASDHAPVVATLRLPAPPAAAPTPRDI